MVALLPVKTGAGSIPVSLKHIISIPFASRPYFSMTVDLFSLFLSDFSDVAVHKMPPDISVEKRLERGHLLMMLHEQIIGRIIYAEVLRDARALNISVVAVKIYLGGGKIQIVGFESRFLKKLLHNNRQAPKVCG